ncbi:IS3 family transposase [Fructobacillus ficulneus]|uniref:Transposase n=1 Tax=Fructobacillus ficulneus TaxID=157463 RepID=A0A0K8MG66_9LACO|nr:IS3 family transposase [Fructobacillus ficulneus]GAO99505.1 transposase [Fructobacillus ficulneus]
MLRKTSKYSQINHKKVQRLMHEMNIQGSGYRKKRAKYNSYPGPNGRTTKNRFRRRFQTDRRLQKLTSDVTEFKVPATGEKLYLEPILDLYNKEIITYSLSTKPDLAFALKPVQELVAKLSKRHYQIYLHTDQGWQYRHRSWQKLLQKNGIKPSMSRKATALDNAPMESFFNKLKTELGELSQFNRVNELREAIQKWIHYYNTERIQIKLKGQSPIEYRQLAS